MNESDFFLEYEEHIKGEDYDYTIESDLRDFISFRKNGGSIQEYKDEHETGAALIEFHKSLSEEDCQAVLDKLYADGVLSSRPEFRYWNQKATGQHPIMYCP